MKFFRPLIALLPAAGLLCAILPPSSCAGAPAWLPWGRPSKLVLPFRSVQDEMVVSLSLNGHAGMNFLIDTGFGGTVLDASAVSEAHLDTLSADLPPIQSLAGAFPLTRTAPRVRISGYGLELHGKVLVGNLELLRKVMGMPIAGIIGFDALGRFPFLVDYSAKTITVFPLKRKKEPAQPGIELPLQPSPPGVADTPILYVDLELPDGQRAKANLTLDTGSNDGLTLHTYFASQHGLRPLDGAQIVTQAAYGGSHNLAPGSVPALFLGDLRIAEPQTLLEQRPLGVAGSKQTDGEIGFEILSRFRVFVDGPRHLVVFEPASQH